MNTNQSKRKKEFRRNADEKAFAGYVRKCAIEHRRNTQEVIGTILPSVGSKLTVDEIYSLVLQVPLSKTYTDKTIHFGEDYQTEKQL